MAQFKILLITLAILACLGVVAIGTVDNLFFGGPERRVTDEPSAIEAALSPGEWIILAGQEILAVQRAAITWEGRMGALRLNDATGALEATVELQARASDARAELSSRPLYQTELEERERSVAALTTVIEGTDRQLEDLAAEDLEAALEEAATIRLALANLRAAPFNQQR